MKALILAAGIGSRLAPITDNHPKCMTLVNGISIIENQILSIRESGIDDIIIVCGYKYDILKSYINEKYKNINYIYNTDYRSTNNMYSAWLAKDYLIGSSFIMMNSDVFIDRHVIKDLIEFNHENAIITDIGSYLEESMKVVEKNGRIINISKQIAKSDALGNSIDIYKFSSESGSIFFNVCENYINNNQKNLWSEIALNDILNVSNFKPCPLHGKWFEIDTVEDLRQAEKLFS